MQPERNNAGSWPYHPCVDLPNARVLKRQTSEGGSATGYHAAQPYLPLSRRPRPSSDGDEASSPSNESRRSERLDRQPSAAAYRRRVYLAVMPPIRGDDSSLAMLDREHIGAGDQLARSSSGGPTSQPTAHVLSSTHQSRSFRAAASSHIPWQQRVGDASSGASRQRRRLRQQRRRWPAAAGRHPQRYRRPAPLVGLGWRVRIHTYTAILNICKMVLFTNAECRLHKSWTKITSALDLHESEPTYKVYMYCSRRGATGSKESTPQTRQTTEILQTNSRNRPRFRADR